MANEADLINSLGMKPVSFTVADGTAIDKGTVLKLTDPRTAIAASAAGDAVAGIAARDKIASDGRTRLAVHVGGIFDMTASGAITVGAPVITSATANHIQAATANESGAEILGYAMETAAANEQIHVRLQPGVCAL